MTDWFAVARSIPFPQVVAAYGQQPGRDHKILCPFHGDGHPSFHVYEDHGYCFSCHSSADGAGYVAKIFDLTPLDAAKKICADFGLTPATEGDSELTERRKQRQAQLEAREFARRLCDSLCNMLSVLREWQEKLAPTPATFFRGAKSDPRVKEVAHWTSYLQYLLEEYIEIDKTTQLDRLQSWAEQIKNDRALYAFGQELKEWK